jgi:hypothetical protein
MKAYGTRGTNGRFPEPCNTAEIRKPQRIPSEGLTRRFSLLSRCILLEFVVQREWNIEHRARISEG